MRYSLFLFFPFLLFACTQKKGLFSEVSSNHSSLTFNNTITETDSINPVDVTNIYNGGGVGIGDFNNDGLQDIYFTGNMVSNKLYLNKGSLQFEDITESAGVTGNGKWCRGVAVVDINNDGWMDMYVCASMNKDPERRKNLLFINKGLDKQGTPVFNEQAAAYGLDDTTHSTMANFFDYDNDGDLDMYLVVNEILQLVNPSVFKPKITDGSFPGTGRLYQNTGIGNEGHPIYKDVSKPAGITIEGYGHAATIADINQDGWKDIFVSNDFIANDLFYINNHDGTFTDKANSYFKHTSANGMGQDVIDINNDGLSDIIELDMNPEDNYRKKMMLAPSSYQSFQLNDYFKYQYQYVRNTVQVNQGPRINSNDSIGDPIFGDAGFFSGMSETDWSWCPLVADFDNDGYRDVIVTNGFPKDITDRDFIAFRKEAAPVTSQEFTLAQIPQVKLHNYAFRNTGNSSFTNVSADWGFDKRSFSNGAAYADLDNDGDLDVVINNINDEASLYENKQLDNKKEDRHYLSIQLKGDPQNVNGLGTWIELFYGNNRQAYEQTPYRGYLSSIQLNPHFGLDSINKIDSVVIKWTNGKKEVLKNAAIDQTLKIDIKNAVDFYDWKNPALVTNNLFTDVTDSLGISYKHEQPDYVDFNIQKLLPHKFSEYGPSLAAGDVNGDGIDDIVIGGNSFLQAKILLQQASGRFLQQNITASQSLPNQQYQDMGLLLFDADADNDLDLYIARGGYESKANSDDYQDQFLLNDGKGNFVRDTTAFPVNTISKSCVRAADYDKDGDLDLFIGGRIEPWQYPKAVSSFIYRNDSKKGQIKFTDVTNEIAPALTNAGLVCDALFTDYDNDGWTDLIVAGEWMPITFLKNNKGRFINNTSSSGIADNTGWWNSITAGDFDNDGDMDYVAANLGQNSFFKASEQYPVSVYAKDFDNNNSYEAILSSYLPASQDSTDRKEFPVPGRDDILKQMLSLRPKFQNYKSYANAEMNRVFSKEQMKDALILKATNFKSGLLKNDGNGKFSFIPLPDQAQLSALNGMIADDYNGDGYLDLAINTNDYGTDVTVGRYDALNGLLLLGDGKGYFKQQTILESGLFIPGNGKAFVKLRSKNSLLLAGSQNRERLKVFKLKPGYSLLAAEPADVYVEIIFRNGSKQKRELFYGSSFLSQSARFLHIEKNIQSVTIYNNKAEKRKIEFN